MGTSSKRGQVWKAFRVLSRFDFEPKTRLPHDQLRGPAQLSSAAFALLLKGLRPYDRRDIPEESSQGAGRERCSCLCLCLWLEGMGFKRWRCRNSLSVSKRKTVLVRGVL